MVEYVMDWGGSSGRIGIGGGGGVMRGRAEPILGGWAFPLAYRVTDSVIRGVVWGQNIIHKPSRYFTGVR